MNNKGYFNMFNLYLSEQSYNCVKKFSHDMLEKNGWIYEFSVASSVLSQYKAKVNKVNDIKFDRWGLRQEILDTIIVIQHLVTHLKISESELSDIALNDKFNDKNELVKEGKIKRTYKRVLEIENYLPVMELKPELDTMCKKVLKKQEKSMESLDFPGTPFLKKTGIQSQLSLAASEASELSNEVDYYIRFNRGKDSKDSKDKKMCNNRDKIIDEIFDVLYCIKYVIQVTGITEKEIDYLMPIRIADLRIKFFSNQNIR